MSSKPIAGNAMSRRLRRMPDLSIRAHLSELMDKPCSYQDLRACLKNLAEVNRTTIAYRPTLQWLEQFARPPFTDRPLHIVDIGCGGGDMLRRIERWAVRRQIAVQLTGIDLNLTRYVLHVSLRRQAVESDGSSEMLIQSTRQPNPSIWLLALISPIICETKKYCAISTGWSR